MASRGSSRSEKVRRIFQQFDANRDGGLNRDEMSALLASVNPRVKFNGDQINAILEEIFRTYAEFIDGDKGLTYDGLLRTYDDGAGDVDRDFSGLELNGVSAGSGGAEPQLNRSPTLAASPNHEIVYDDTWKLIDDAEMLIKRLKAKQGKDGKSKGDNSDAYSDPGWSREFGPPSEMSDKSVVWDESGPDYAVFVKGLGILRSRADGARSREEAFDGHMAVGKILYDHHLYKEALVDFKRACELQPPDVRPHFRAGNCLYILGRHSEAKEEFLLVLEVAEAGGNQWTYLLPQIHVNLGIALEGEGMVLSACEHYREAAILCPTHFRALKLLGSALFGAGEYRAAVKALEEAIYLKADYADAHCDLASALHSMGDHENAIIEFQKAIDLKPGHVDALYNLGGLYMDMGRFHRASEMYARVLGVQPYHWRSQLNKAASLLGIGETKEAHKALKEALKMTNRVELHDAISHLKQLKRTGLKGNGGANWDDALIDVEPSRFRTVDERTMQRQDLANALDIRAFQKVTRLSRFDVELLAKEMTGNSLTSSYPGSGAPEKSIRKASLEAIVRRLLHFLEPEAFVAAVKAINQKILSAVDKSESGRVDLGIFFAVLAPVCSGSPEKRKRAAFDALLWRPGSSEIKKVDALRYIKLLRAIYLPTHGMSEMLEIHSETDTSLVVSFTDFLVMFDDPDSGFGIMSSLLKLETGDRNRHGTHVCSACRYPIVGSRFKEMKSHFSLCSQCYSEGKVPPTFKQQEEYRFKESASGVEAVKDNCICFSLHPKNPSHADPLPV